MKEIPEAFVANACQECTGSSDLQAINVASVATIVRSLGLAPTLADINRFADTYGHNGLCTLEHLRAWIKQLQKNHDETHDFQNFMRLFETFDTEKTGYIRVQVLRSLLTQVGEVLTEEEFDVVKTLVGDDDKVHYATFVQRLMSGA